MVNVSYALRPVDPDPTNAEKIKAWTKDYWAALHPYNLGGAYVNFMMGEGIERVKATYRDNTEQLLHSASVYGWLGKAIGPTA